MTYQSPSLLVVNYLMALPSATLDTMADVDTSYGRLIFLDALPIKVSGSGKRAITVRNTPGANPSTHDYGAVCSFSLYADHTRSGGNVAQEDGIQRAWAVFGNLDQVMHSPDPILSGSIVVQSDRAAPPLESFDQQQNLPYIAVNYDVTVHMGK